MNIDTSISAVIVGRSMARLVATIKRAIRQANKAVRQTAIQKRAARPTSYRNAGETESLNIPYKEIHI